MKNTVVEVKLKVGKFNGTKIIAEFTEFKIKGEFNDWSTNPDHYVLKVPLNLEKTSNNYYNVFHANYCENVNSFEIHVAIVNNLNEESKSYPYVVSKQKQHFNLDPKVPKSKVKVSILLYDLHERCPGDKLIYICGDKKGKEIDHHPLKDKPCPPQIKFRVPPTPEQKDGNILIGEL